MAVEAVWGASLGSNRRKSGRRDRRVVRPTYTDQPKAGLHLSRCNAIDMPSAFDIARIISIGSFLAYGLTCLFSLHMVDEFERFRLSRYRRFTGALEVAGALGLLAGIFVPPVTLAASGGLSALMALGIGVRFSAGDSLYKSTPALLFLFLNFFILIRGLQAI